MQQSSIINQRYRVVDFLGAGGFGETFLVEDLEMPSKRRCVLKCLKPIADDPATYGLIQERFLREATILETLGSHHPQIPTLYAYFQRDGRFYLVQEWIAGQTLLEFVQAGPMADHQVRAMLDSLLATLEYVHSQQIIHRDIKPENIILRSQDLEPVLLDFGAVKEAMRTAIRTPQAPQSSIVVGTPGFMPSEQSIGRPVYSSDLYALGLTAIYALTQKLPDSLASDPATGQLLWRHEIPTIAPDLADVIDQAIAPHAPHRFASASHMRSALTGKSPAASGVPSQVATVVAAPKYVPTKLHPPSHDRHTQVRPRPQATHTGLTDWQKALLTGGVVGGFIFLGLVVPRLPIFTGEPEATPPETATTSNSEVENAEENGANPAAEAPQEQNAPADIAPSEPSQSADQSEAPPANEPPAEEAAPTTTANALDASSSAAVVENLYDAIAAGNWEQAAAYFSADMRLVFDPDFFRQFDRVTVANLRVTSQTDSTITLVGENTYVWPDGSTQREERSYTVSYTDGQALISGSDFVRVTELRN